MELIKADDSDNDRLLHYYSQTVFPGPIRLRIRRMFHYFNQFRNLSDDYVTYILQNDKKEIEAMASLVFRDGYIDGQKESIGYATDLRVSPTRRAVLTWSQHFLPVLEAERSQRDCKYMFTVVPQSQRQAYNAFIRPRNFRRHMPRYHLFRRFRVVTLHGLWPFHDLPLPGIKIRSATENDFEQLADYILEQTENRPVKYYVTKEEFRKHLDRWRDLFIENFLIAFDKDGQIIGCTAPWSPERVQRIYPVSYDSKAKNLQEILRVLSWMGLAHPLPKVNNEFNICHLTHLYANNPDIFYSLLYSAYEQLGKKEFLAYTHFEGELATLPPRSFISAETSFGLYCILSPNDPIPEFLKPKSLMAPPMFEAASI